MNLVAVCGGRSPRRWRENSGRTGSQSTASHLATYSVLRKSVAKSRVFENAIDSRTRIKTTTYSDVQQKPCQFYWHGLLHVTIDTEMTAAAGQGIIDWVISTTPVGRLGLAEEVGAAAKYLVESAFVTGTVMPVDGGQILNTWPEHCMTVHCSGQQVHGCTCKFSKRSGGDWSLQFVWALWVPHKL